MTADKNRKRLVRERQARTGESYTAALRHLRGADPPDRKAVDPGIPVDGRVVIEAYRDLMNARQPELVQGLYLVGSAALGEFESRDSDLDFIAVSSTVMTDPELKDCTAVHEAVEKQFPRPVLSGIYVTWDQLRASPATAAGVSMWHEGRLAPVEIAGYPVGNVNPVQWLTLAEYGVTVVGPPPSTLGVYCDRDELTRWNLQNLDTYWRRAARWARNLPTQAAAAFTAQHVVWMILGPPRLHYTIATGDITTKIGAGQYALKHFPECCRELVGDALAVRRHEATTFRERDIERLKTTVADFIDFVITDAHQLTPA